MNLYSDAVCYITGFFVLSCCSLYCVIEVWAWLLAHYVKWQRITKYIFLYKYHEEEFHRWLQETAQKQLENENQGEWGWGP